MFSLIQQLTFYLIEDGNRPKKNTSHQECNKFDDPDSPLLPPAIPSWHRAMTTLKSRADSLGSSDVNPIDKGYIFPEPALFLSVQNKQRQDVYFTTWLKYRTAMIYRLSSSTFTATPMPNAVWRNFLSIESVDSKNPGSSTSDPPSRTRAAKLREMAHDFLQNCLEAEVNLAQSNDAPITWNGDVVTIHDLSDLQREEVLWELAELNFRFELLALDSRATTTTCSDSVRQQLVSACFPNCDSGPLLVADLGGANHGLASQDWEERARYLHALKRVMMSWQGELPSILKMEKVHWHALEVQELEDAITEFYVTSFYKHFQRPPIVPRGLSHSAVLYRAPTPPEVTVINPLPNTFYDVSRISSNK
jgi:hypothetical protein